ncbi:GTP-binding protein ypt2 [Tritrichomonas foetus]|uniref:GTP-binding protein ypt2 n=1 Tax=Tritrichomonas foetus TaxID=1144522 RepID=A0A1J4KVQ3_9EUKA|nr:GTP-binding protein ypt2 [Tritrichomonas foetus]|eukprot:OHT13597.1 GTP-binding protein ypt2 [Tritrichomonas foetus]
MKFSPKIVLVGDAFVGKTSIAIRYRTTYFESDVSPTIGSSNLYTPIKMPDGNVIMADIWDTAGEERYRSLTPLYIQNAKIVLLVFDFTRQHSFNNLQIFISLIKDMGSQDAKIIVVGNKCDMKEEIAVSFEDAKEYCDEIHANAFHMTSAVTGEGINELFLNIGEICSKMVLDAQNFIAKLDDGIVTRTSKRCC